jgi:hypothetical protein
MVESKETISKQHHHDITLSFFNLYDQEDKGYDVTKVAVLIKEGKEIILKHCVNSFIYAATIPLAVFTSSTKLKITLSYKGKKDKMIGIYFYNIDDLEEYNKECVLVMTKTLKTLPDKPDTALSFFIFKNKVKYFITNPSSYEHHNPSLDTMLTDLRLIHIRLDEYQTWLKANNNKFENINLSNLCFKIEFKNTGILNTSNLDEAKLMNLIQIIEPYRSVYDCSNSNGYDTNEFNLHVYLVELCFRLSRFLFKLIRLEATKCTFFLTLAPQTYFELISDVTAKLYEILTLLDEYGKENLVRNDIKDYKKIKIKTKISIFTTYFDDFDIGSLSRSIFEDEFTILKLNDLESQGRHLKSFEQAFIFMKDIFNRLDANSLLFNMFSLVNSKIRRNADNTTDGFFFEETNDFKKTKDDLDQLLPEYIVQISTEKLHKNQYIHGLSDYNKLIFINISRIFHSDDRKFLIGIFLILLHELTHSKRMCFASAIHGTRSPLIKTNIHQINSKAKMDMGTVLEHFILVNYLVIYREITTITFWLI